MITNKEYIRDRRAIAGIFLEDVLWFGRPIASLSMAGFNMIVSMIVAGIVAIAAVCTLIWVLFTSLFFVVIGRRPAEKLSLKQIALMMTEK